jgi:hypothetical protein
MGVLACIGYCALAAVSGLGAATKELPERWQGRWVIYKDLGAPGISAMTDAEAKATLRAEIDLGDGSARFYGEACAAPSYTIDEQTIGDFLLGFKLMPSVFHLVGSRVEVLNVHCQHSVSQTLALLETGCVLSAREGHFFQAVKARPGHSVGEEPIAACLE